MIDCCPAGAQAYPDLCPRHPYIAPVAAPSPVGSVPVEVLEDIPADIVEKIAAAICPGEGCEAHSECRDDVPAVWAAAYPLIAARVRAEERQRWTTLVEALAPEEPMSQDEQGGCVWCGGPGYSQYATADPATHESDCPWVAGRQALAAGSAVPVATPEGPPCCDLHGRNCERGGEECCEYCTESGHDASGFRTGRHRDGSLCSRRDLSPNTIPVATPTEPARSPEGDRKGLAELQAAAQAEIDALG